ncbi:hypothetical protein ILYODFUR_038427 [Ilyodon furcidens]|uniref:Uncharacterized protein n=1 Tax=Ilyodon furcidens TaxID=33524 RepID=A0ABV0UMY8_9TELE
MQEEAPKRRQDTELKQADMGGCGRRRKSVLLHREQKEKFPTTRLHMADHREEEESCLSGRRSLSAK